MSKWDLLTEQPKRLFLRYLIPAICSNVFLSIYVITDTMMIGHGIGSDGLVALNILLPLYQLFFAFGYMFGIGGSVLMSIANGKGNEKDATAIFTTTLLSLLAIGISLSLFGFFCLEPVARLLGAEDQQMPLILEYGRWLMGFGLIFMLSPMLQSFVKNDKEPKRAMAASVIGSMLNVLLDYVLIFPLHMGMSGAIIATILGAVTNCVVTASHFFSTKNSIHFRFHDFRPTYVWKIMKNGASSFLTEISVGVVIFVFNLQILSYLGDSGIVIYSVISNIAIVVNALLNGSASSVQPIISFNLGAGAYDRVKKIRTVDWISTFLMTVILYGCIFLWTKACIYAFVTPSRKELEMGISAIRIYFSGSFGLCINTCLSNYFQAVGRSTQAFIIGLLRGLVICVILVFLLPVFFPPAVIWWVMPLTEGVTALVALYFFLQKRLYL